MAPKIRVHSTDKHDAVVSSFASTTKPSKDLEFNTFVSSKSGRPAKMHSQNDSLLFQANEIDDNCDYYVGIQGKDADLLDVVPVTLMEGSTIVKRMIEHDLQLEKENLKRQNAVSADYASRRNDLGQAFGTKRAKKAISDATKNKVDAELVNQDEQDQIIKNISASTSLMPSKVEMQEQADREARILPLAHEDATHVEEIYPLEDLIYTETLESFRVDSMVGQSNEEILSKLPYKHNQDSILMQRLLKLNNNSKSSLQLLCYFSTVLGFYFNKRVKKLEDLQSKYQIQPSPSTLKTIVGEFAIKFGVNGNRVIQLDSKQEDKILAHIIVVLLHLLQFQIELAPLANELALKPIKLLALVRSIGCNVRPINLSEAKDFNVPKAKVASYKIAELKCPFKAPQITRQRVGGNGSRR